MAPRASSGTPTLVLQGIESPNTTIDPTTFFRFTRRMRYMMQARKAIIGQGSTDSVQLKQTGIINKLHVRVTGTVTATAGAATTWLYPYGIVRNFRLSVNGQANLFRLPGIDTKIVNVVMNPLFTSNGTQRMANAAVGAYNKQNSTLSLPSEDWGTYTAANTLGPNVSALTANTYTIDLIYEIPLAYDSRSLIGAVYAQTTATNLQLEIDWETATNLTQTGTLTFTLQFSVMGEVYSIPQVGNRYVVPDVSAFHQIIGWQSNALIQGDNEIPMPGTGLGRQLMRTGMRVLSGSPQAPMVVNDTNFGGASWMYGGADRPETISHAAGLRYINELETGEDIGGLWGGMMWDFGSTFAFRDSVDEGATTDLRLVINLPNAPTNGVAQCWAEAIVAAPAGA